MGDIMVFVELWVGTVLLVGGTTYSIWFMRHGSWRSR